MRMPCADCGIGAGWVLPAAWVVLSAVVLLAGGTGGCDRPNSSHKPAAPTAPSTRPATRPAAATGAATQPGQEGQAGQAGRPRPGYATGHVVGEDGKPIGVEGSHVTISVRGVSHESSEVVNLFPEVRPDGAYEQKLPDGTYRPITGVVEVPFGGRYCRFDLDPAQSATDSTGRRIAESKNLESKDGIVQDFVWRLSGLRPGYRRDETDPAAWYGGMVTLLYQGFRQDLQHAIPLPPRGTRVVFTFTPVGLRPDGLEGKVLTVERKYDNLLGLENKEVSDVPLAFYRLSGSEIFPDGRTDKLLFPANDGGWADSVDFTFEPDLEQHRLKPARIPFTRPGQ